VNFFDTADVYGLGRSEILLSEALGPNAKKVVIASKFGVRWDSDGRTWKDISAKHMVHALEESLRRLKLDCIPLYYIHWPDLQTPIEEPVAALERMRQAGNIRAIGLSNFSAEDIDRACDVAPISALQLQYSLLNWQVAHAALPIARLRGIPFITWGSLAQGLLSGKYDETSVFQADDRRNRYENFRGSALRQNLRVVESVKQLASRLGKSSIQLAIRWLLQTNNVGSVLAGCKRPSQVEENLGALDFSLTAEHYRLLTEAARNALLESCDNAQVADAA
jgi:aryl-alcohol dehydrogenase-like predicted oxidoreductase